ncbi:NeuD/PglB/VioB family sugar acetyltransferase [Mariniflexile sp.]|uniref:NeuD/PglB/VioB family sugar acetyltransferase n=1 Tax=Mariniflexile sp. TaxID=1979402 RepID=UPI00356AB502
MKKILIIGASGHAKVVIDIVEKQGEYQIFGLIDSYKQKGGKIYDYTILGTEETIPEISNTEDIYGCIIAIGDNFTRKKLYKKISELHANIHFVSAIHPNAVIGKNVTIGDGTVVMAGTIINSDTIIGKHCILNTKCSIDHDMYLGDFSSIAPGVTIGGNVEVNKCSAISLGAKIIENVKIGNNTVVGAGALVLKSFGDNEIVYGSPAKSIRSRTESDSYLGLIETNELVPEYSLNYVSISTENDIENYNSLIQEFREFNMFYSIEYCNHSLSKKLNYFLFKKNDDPYILLPFFLNEINSPLVDSRTKYFDVSTPYGFSGPLINKRTTNTDIKYFWEYVDNWYKSNNVVTEFIRFHLNNNHSGYSGKLIPTLSNVHGKLTDFNELWFNFKPKVRNNYRKAISNKLRSEISFEVITAEILEIFYDIYIKTMFRNEASQNYFLSYNYFENLVWNHKNKIALILIYQGKTAISTELLIINDGTMYSYLGGTLSEYFNLRPNDFLKIEMIKWGLKNNLKYYSLGGGRTENDTLYQYKKTFFPKDEDIMFYTGRKIVNHQMYYLLCKDFNLDYKELENILIDPKIYFPLYNNKLKDKTPG